MVSVPSPCYAKDLPLAYLNFTIIGDTNQNQGSLLINQNSESTHSISALRMRRFAL